MAKIPREVFGESSSGLKERRERTGDKERWRRGGGGGRRRHQTCLIDPLAEDLPIHPGKIILHQVIIH